MLIVNVFFGVFFGLYALLLGLLQRRRRTQKLISTDLPRVSILIAARNEEANIERCLASLTRLNYPADKLEILIGDDASTDHTAAVVSRFIEGKPQFRLLSIRHQLGTARGKSNVLAHLSRAATTDYLFITDADMALAPNWIQTLLAAAPPGVGVVTGITTAEGNLFGRLQGLDWLFGLNLIRVISDLGLPVTAIGNNMMVTRAAYESIGGYESMAFTVTEDLQLFEKVVHQGWGFRNITSPQALGVSVAQPTVYDLLKQRKRWMRGSVRLPWYLMVLFGLNALFYVVVFWPNLLLPQIAWGLFGLKMIFQTAFLAVTLRQVGRRESLGVLLLYEVYLAVMSIAVLAYTLWPNAIQWKERRYRWAEV